MSAADPKASALFLGAFFDELARWGVRDVVVSPGSRSTPLSMTAYELSRCAPKRMRVFVDVDERGAAFFALGMAKASGRPAAVVCTSGTAVANYYPAVLEAESSRVPLLLLTGDRPPRLQGLGAPQTCDQLNAYGAHVRAFRQMPLPSGDAASVGFARQAAREACIATGASSADAGAASPRIAGTCTGGPVQVNFPFEEPLKPDFTVEGLFEPPAQAADASEAVLHGAVAVRGLPAPADLARIAALLDGRRALVLAGEGSCATAEEARAVLAWARAFDMPLLADPLSGLRSCNDPLVVDCYDTLINPGGMLPDNLTPQVIIRFGRYPVSKKATQMAAAGHALQVVVDPLETRDFNAATGVFVPCEPVDFARAMVQARSGQAPSPLSCQQDFAAAWRAANNAAAACVAAVDDQPRDGFEGAYVSRVAALAPEGSCLFAANSMSVRALDTFYLKSDKRLTVLCNRGLNGIDGTVSSALGAAQSFPQTTLITGDLTLLHDLNALALQRELRVQRQLAANAEPAAFDPGIVIVLLNNNGGGIFDMLPQKSQDPYFERLFLTPQDVDFEAAARAFEVPYARVETVADFDSAYCGLLGRPGISLLEVRVPLVGLKERYQPYWSCL